MKQIMLFSLMIVSTVLCSQDRKFDSNILKEYFQITDDSQTDYPIKDIMQGCPKVDCIVSIDKPKFISASEVDFLQENSLIMAVTLAGETRVYPTMTLQIHEIVNDQIGKVPYAVTYCPLCGTGVVYSRKINNTTVEFGVSGVLHGSDLVMYDRSNKNLWQQLTGRAFAGPDRGYQLQSIPVVMTDWKTWLQKHPQSKVLSNSKDKLSDRYKKYRSSDKVMFGGVTDPRLNPKRVVYGLTVNSQAIAIDFEMIKKKKSFSLTTNKTELMIQYQEDGRVVITDSTKKTAYKLHRSYWFAWFTFHPSTLLFKE